MHLGVIFHFFTSVINQSPSCFLNFAFFCHPVFEFIHYAIDEVLAFGSAVIFGDINVFVHGHLDGYSREEFKFTGCHFNNNQIDNGNTFYIPVGNTGFNQNLKFFIVFKGAVVWRNLSPL